MTIATDLGFVVGEKYKLIDKTVNGDKPGDYIKFIHDDGSDCPFFKSVSGGEGRYSEFAVKLRRLENPTEVKPHQTDVQGIEVKLLHEDAKVPTRGSTEAAGLDLHSIRDYNVYPGAVERIHTGVSLALPPGYVGLIWPRSGLAIQGIDTMAGVIDSDYRGEIIVLLINHSMTPVRINKGDRMAQMIVQQHAQLPLQTVDVLSGTERSIEG